MSGGELATIISASIVGNGALIGAVAFFMKRFIPKMVSSYMEFVFTEFANLRQSSDLKTEKYIESVGQLTRLASNHLTDFSREICNKLDDMSQAIMSSNLAAIESNQMKDEAIESLNILLGKLINTTNEKGGE